MKKLFSAPPRSTPNPEVSPSVAKAPAPAPTPSPVDHQSTFGMVYANDLARVEIARDARAFPVGSIIVREKNETATSEIPQTAIAMVKRAKGFSSQTNDWEFFMFDGKDLKLQTRETTGNCATCHSKAEKTDWVFRSHLK